MPAALTPERKAADREALLDAVEDLVYANGVRAVGMDRIRELSGLSLKQIYALFPTKEDLVVAMLRRRDRRWLGDLTARVEQVEDPTARILAVFDWLGDFFATPGFRGCAWINIHGELGSESDAVRSEVRAHKNAFRAAITTWADAARTDHAEAIYLLAEGAMVTAGITGDPEVADRARATAEHLLDTRPA
ncbi:putative transcriptional regulator, TetR family [Nocardia nova SH22a]|uniref:Putative transcriptional regulator, TetR family n=1 Tax=Nocardia nova SH22a TaxID=1415166 RepID=W5TNF8_9NOCA|nr:TetR/AcrR family transcriptional regulator [Nocardia nova]AHH20689.1 putative transcriptional regulator, TetR family [Nocardia nova SH22a]